MGQDPKEFTLTLKYKTNGSMDKDKFHTLPGLSKIMKQNT